MQKFSLTLWLLFSFQIMLLGKEELLWNVGEKSDSTYIIHVELEILKGDLMYLEFPSWGEISLKKSDSILAVSGSDLPFNSKTYPSSRNLIPVFDKGKYAIELKKSKFYEVAIEEEKFLLGLIDPVELKSQEKSRLIFQSLFFGIILVMSLYNLLIFFSVGDKSYLYYVLSIIGLGLYLFFFFGFSIEFFWPEAPRWDAHFFALVIPLTNMARLSFARSYLHTDEYTPIWDKVLFWMLLSYAIPLCIWLLSYFGSSSYLIIASQIIGVQGVFVLSIITVVSIIVVIRGYKPAKWFLMAYIFFNIGGVLFILRELNYLPENFSTRYFLEIGATAQVILFSLGLSDRYNRTKAKLANEILEKEQLEKSQILEKNTLIEKQRKNLEAKVRERTDDLEKQIKLTKASESELYKLNAVKDKLFSLISHELKNPLVTVDSFLNLFINHYDRLTEEEKIDLGLNTHQALQRLTLLLDNLLQWSRMQQNDFVFQPSQVSVNESFNRAKKLYELPLNAKNIVLESNLNQGRLSVWADKNMLDFIFRNLLSNAIKFTPSGGSIFISASEMNQMVEISVKDTGSGINQFEIEKILNGISFSKDGTENEKGTGIGLLMCKDFIERNGGEFKIISDEKGTDFIFLLPEYL